MNRKFKENLFLCLFLFLFAAEMNAQDIRAITALKEAKISFEAKHYEETIKKCDQGLAMCSDNDSLRVELLLCKALCSERKKAVPLLKEALNIYSKTDDNLYYRVACKYCSEYSYSPNNNYENMMFEENVVRLIDANHCLDRNLHKYKEYLLAKFGYDKKLSGTEEINKALIQENRKFDIGSKRHLDIISPFLKYVKANLLSRDYINTWGTYYSKKNSNSLSLYKECANEFLKLNTSVSNKFLSECYDEIKDSYQGVGDNLSAIIYQKKILDIQDKYWNEWKYKSPWSYPANYGGDELAQFTNYVELLTGSRQYKKIVAYCDQLLSDDRLKYLGNTSVGRVQQEKDKALSYLEESGVDKKEDEFEKISGGVSNLIQSYENGNVTSQLFHEYFEEDDIESFYSYIINEKKDYKSMLKIFSYFQEYVKQFTGIYFTEDDVAKGKCSQYDLEIDAEREHWHHANGNSSLWTTYYYAALAYLELGDYTNAIKCQKRVIDNVRTDWLYEKEERNELINNYLDDRATSNWPLYWQTELDMYCELARIYLCAKKYEKAFDTYQQVMGINIQILQGILKSHSISTIQNEWENNYYWYTIIISNLSDKTKEYPNFSKLIFEASIMQKGFLLNQVKQINIQKSQRLGQVERLLEKSNYTQSADRDILIEEMADYDYTNSHLLESNKILEKSAVSMVSVRQSLNGNDVLVDFYVVGSKENNFKKEGEIVTQQQEDGNWVASQKVWSFNDFCLYANVLRSEWLCPKVVYIGKLSELYTAEGKDIWDFAYLHNSEPGYIKKLYSDTSVGNKIWGKILEVAMVSKEDNVYFIPDNIINKIAIENLATGGGTPFSDIYKVHRISSVHEIKSNSRYSQSDRCVAFGGTQFPEISKNGKFSGATKTLSNSDAGTLLNGDARALLNRNILSPLTSNRNILATIDRCVPNTVSKLGLDANELEFYKLDGHSPEILFIGSHGFCYETSDLNKEQKEYLFGKYRDETLQKEEEHMYSSGIFLAQTGNTEIMTDGVLTAKEISMMNLRNTKIAILSACSTANGRPTVEGVYGLLRGFKMAGVQSILATLWDVDENATQLFMTEFCKFYTGGYDKRTALKKAQSFLRNYKSNDVFHPVNYSNPFYWAGFILLD